MFCELSYRVDKEALRTYFLDNFHKTLHHKTAGSEMKTWRKLFDTSETVQRIVHDLGLSDLDVRPRFSWQMLNTRLAPHIDHDGIVGLNFNLRDEPAVIHIRGKAYEYESALIDVGAVPHSVEPVPYNRLVLKLAIRAPWSTVYRRVRHLMDSPLDDYESRILDEERHLVKL